MTHQSLEEELITVDDLRASVPVADDEPSFFWTQWKIRYTVVGDFFEMQARPVTTEAIIEELKRSLNQFRKWERPRSTTRKFEGTQIR